MSVKESKPVSPVVAIGVIIVVIGLIGFFFFQAANSSTATKESVTIPPDVAAHLGTQQQGPAPNAEQAKQHH